MNPFSPIFPVNPRYFINREAVLSSFRTAFGRSIKTEMPTPDNIAILGEVGIGKTSVLRKFEAIALEEFKDRKVFSAIVEFDPVYCSSFSSVFCKVVEDISGNFITNTTVSMEIKNEIRDWRIESIKKGRIESEKNGKEIPPLSAAKDMFIYLEVSEEDNPRRSFDINLYKANLKLHELYPFLSKTSRHYSIPPEEFDPLYDQIRTRLFGHLAGGIDREGKDFLTIYYEVE